MADGWLKLYRALAHHDLWTAEPFTRGQAFVDLLLLANYKPGYIRVQGLKVEVERGDVAWSEVNLSARWQWSRGKVRRFLDELIDDGMVVKKRYSQQDKRKSVITIANYEKYQSDHDTNSTGDDTSDEQAMTQATDKRRYRNKKEKKDKKKGRNTSCGQPAETAVLPPQVIPIDAVVSLPLNTGEPYPITQAKVEELAPLYPAVDVAAELRKMAGWLIGNPTHRKTRAGIMRFATSWLAKAQDRGGTSPPPGQLRPNTVFQQKQIEGGQKARMLQEIRRQEHGRETGEELAGDGAQVASESRPCLPAEAGRGRVGGADGPVDRCTGRPLASGV